MGRCVGVALRNDSQKVGDPSQSYNNLRFGVYQPREGEIQSLVKLERHVANKAPGSGSSYRVEDCRGCSLLQLHYGYMIDL